MSNTRFFASNKSSDFMDDNFMINKEPTLNEQSENNDPFKVKLTSDNTAKKLREAQRTHL